LVGDGVPWINIAERERSIVVVANSRSRSNDDSLSAALCLKRQRIRRDINTHDQSDSGVGARSDRKDKAQKRCREQASSHHDLLEE
jgi:hypothetical protein